MTRRTKARRRRLTSVQRVVGGTGARQGVQAVGLIFEFLCRCRPAPDMAALARPRRSERRVFARQCPLAGCEGVSIAAIDRSDTLTPRPIALI